MTKEIDLGLGVLDHQLLDSEGRRCGNVDDLELEGVRDGTPRVVAILTGPPAWSGRGRLGKLASRLASGPLVRVPWKEVEAIKSGVHLRKRAEELGLGRGDDRARRIVEKIPGASL
jgi:sporulation protein YlmC with PRC-barrel domain